VIFQFFWKPFGQLWQRFALSECFIHFIFNGLTYARYAVKYSDRKQKKLKIAEMDMQFSCHQISTVNVMWSTPKTRRKIILTLIHVNTKKSAITSLVQKLSFHIILTAITHMHKLDLTTKFMVKERNPILLHKFNGE